MSPFALPSIRLPDLLPVRVYSCLLGDITDFGCRRWERSVGAGVDFGCRRWDRWVGTGVDTGRRGRTNHSRRRCGPTYGLSGRVQSCVQRFGMRFRLGGSCGARGVPRTYLPCPVSVGSTLRMRLSRREWFYVGVRGHVPLLRLQGETVLQEELEGSGVVTGRGRGWWRGTSMPPVGWVGCPCYPFGRREILLPHRVDDAPIPWSDTERG